MSTSLGMDRSLVVSKARDRREEDYSLPSEVADLKRVRALIHAELASAKRGFAKENALGDSNRSLSWRAALWIAPLVATIALAIMMGQVLLSNIKAQRMELRLEKIQLEEEEYRRLVAELKTQIAEKQAELSELKKSTVAWMAVLEDISTGTTELQKATSGNHAAKLSAIAKSAEGAISPLSPACQIVCSIKHPSLGADYEICLNNCMRIDKN